jgi:hypothetical protein
MKVLTASLMIAFNIWNGVLTRNLFGANAHPHPLNPAKAGIQRRVPACAGIADAM